MQTRDSNRPWRPLGVVGAVTVLVVLVVLLAGLLVRPGYTSSAQVYLSGSTGDENGTALRARVASYAALAESLPLATRVDRRLGLDGTPGDLQHRIAAEAVPGTLLLRVRVTASSAAAAQRIATGVLDQLGRLAANAESGSGAAPLRTVTGPTTPTARDSRHLVRHALVLGVPLGLGLGLLAALALVMIGRRAGRRGRPSDPAAAVDAPLLGGLRLPEVATETGEHGPDEDLEHLRQSVRFLGVDTDGPVLVVAAAHEQGDAVDTAIQLAGSIARAGDPVLLIDADLRSGEVAERLDLAGGGGLSSVLVGDTDLAAAVQLTDHHLPAVLAVLPRGQLPPNPAQLAGSAALRRLLAEAHTAYRTVIVVSPRPDDAPDCARLAAAGDGVVLVVRPGTSSERRLKRIASRATASGGALLGVITTGGPETGPQAGPAPVEAAAPPVPDEGATDPTDTHEAAPAAPSPIPWPDSHPEDAEDADDAADDAGVPEHQVVTSPAASDPWAIRETPDNPEPFWVGARDDEAADPLDAEIPQESPAEPAVPEEPRSPWLSREGEVWTPPEPPPTADHEPVPASWDAPDTRPTSSASADLASPAVLTSSATGPSIAERVAEALRARRDDVQAVDHARRRPLTAGDLVDLRRDEEAEVEVTAPIARREPGAHRAVLDPGPDPLVPGGVTGEAEVEDPDREPSGSLLDEFLTEADEPAPAPPTLPSPRNGEDAERVAGQADAAPRPRRRAERGSLWRPSRWSESD